MRRWWRGAPEGQASHGRQVSGRWKIQRNFCRQQSFYFTVDGLHWAWGLGKDLGPQQPAAPPSRTNMPFYSQYASLYVAWSPALPRDVQVKRGWKLAVLQLAEQNATMEHETFAPQRTPDRAKGLRRRGNGLVPTSQTRYSSFEDGACFMGSDWHPWWKCSINKFIT